MSQSTKKFREVSDFDSWTSEDFLPGAIVVDAGNSVLYSTGGWRSNRPEWNAENCTSCMMCWMHCPDSSILVKDQKMTGIDYDHCKGCGICAVECRFDAIEMVQEQLDLQPEGGN